MAKTMLYSTQARKKLLKGIEKTVNAAKVTLGPGGRHVMLNTVGENVVTKDGVTVVKGIDLKDPYENMGAQFIKDMSSKSNDDVGDGTTTVCVLSKAILQEGIKVVETGSNPVYVKRGMDKASQLIVDQLKKISKPVEGDDIKNVATISANNDSDMGQLVADAIAKVGKDGVITVEESKTMSTTVKVTEGLQIKEGYISPYFLAENEKTVEYQDAFILIYDKTISSMKDLLPTLEAVAQTGKPLVIIAENVDGEALTALVINNMRGALKACAIKAPSFGDNRKAILQDIATVTGATVITEEVGLKLDQVSLDMLGQAKSIKISKDDTTIVNGAKNRDKIDARIEEIRTQIEDAKNNGSISLDVDRLRERLAKLSGGVAVIELGAATEAEMKEKRYRIDDTLAATRAALEEGIVPGGGVALIRASSILTDELIDSVKDKDEQIGYQIIKKSVEAPLWQIVENTGVSGDVVVNNVKESKDNYGYNAKTGEYCDLLSEGVIDPAKVTRCALQNAVSTAGTLLTTECIIVDEPESTSTNVSNACNTCPSAGMDY